MAVWDRKERIGKIRQRKGAWTTGRRMGSRAEVGGGDTLIGKRIGEG